MKKLKVGFLIDETDVSYCISDLIRHVEDSDLFESPTLITGYKKNSPRSFGEKLISIQGADLETIKVALDYFYIMIGGSIFMVFSVFFRSILSGEGEMMFPMKVHMSLQKYHQFLIQHRNHLLLYFQYFVFHNLIVLLHQHLV